MPAVLQAIGQLDALPLKYLVNTHWHFDYSSGGSASGCVDGMAKMLSVAKDSTKIVPGHGPLGSKVDLASAHDMLATVRDRVAAAKKSDKSLDETVASKPTADFDAKWAKGLLTPDQFVTVVNRSLP